MAAGPVADRVGPRIERLLHGNLVTVDPHRLRLGIGPRCVGYSPTRYKSALGHTDWRESLKRPTIAKCVALLAALALVAAACGGDDSSSGSGATAAATGTCDASKATIKIGSVTTAQNYAGMDEAIQARLDRENKTCIGGRKLEFVGSRDDAGDVQKNLDGAKDLVENKKADALLITSDRNVQTGAYLATAKVPFAGWGFMPELLRQRRLGSVGQWLPFWLGL